MAEITLDLIKELRERSGDGIMDCKRALEATGGNLDKAVAYLQEQGIASAAKKANRETSQGLIDSYIHAGRIGALVEVNCETDFVARTDDFKNLVHEIAMHVAAANPQYLAADDIPAGKYYIVSAEAYVRGENFQAHFVEENHGNSLLVRPVCATGEALPATYTAPAPEERAVIAGNTISLGGVEILLEVSSCDLQPCICQ